MAIGTLFSFGFIFGWVKFFFGDSSLPLTHDELRVISYGRVKRVLSRLRNEGSPEEYYRKIALLLPWSPWRRKLLDDLVEVLGKSNKAPTQVFNTLANLETRDAREIIDALSERRSSLEARLQEAVRLHHILARDPGRGLLQMRLHRYFRGAAPFREGLLGWESVLPSEYRTEESWKSALEEFRRPAGRNTAPDTFNNPDDDTVEYGRTFDATMLEFILEDGEEYFRRPTIPAPVVECKNTTIRLHDRQGQVEFMVVNTARKPIRLNSVSIGFETKEGKGKVRLNGQQTYDSEPRTRLMPSHRHHIRLDIESFRKQLRGRFKIELTYTHSGSGRSAGQETRHVAKRIIDVHFATERPFQKIDPNPFTRRPVETREGLFGRDRLLSEIINTLGSQLAGNVLMVRGTRRIGKTSLLHVLDKILTDRGIDTVFFDMQKRSRILRSNSPMKAFLTELATAYFEKHRASEAPPPIVDEDSFIEAVGKDRVVFLVDEFDILLGALEDEMLNLWSNRWLSGSSVLMVCAAPDTALRGMDLNVMNTLFSEHSWSLAPLPDDAVEELIQQPVQGFLNFEPRAIEAIKSLAGGFPVYLQAVCGAVVEFMNDQGDTTVVSEGLVQQSLDYVVEDYSSLMVASIRLLGDEELDILNMLASNKNRIDIDDPRLDNKMARRGLMTLEGKNMIKVDHGGVTCTASLMLKSVQLLRG
jgi:hypothetical protein